MLSELEKAEAARETARVVAVHDLLKKLCPEGYYPMITDLTAKNKWVSELLGTQVCVLVEKERPVHVRTIFPHRARRGTQPLGAHTDYVSKRGTLAVCTLNQFLGFTLGKLLAERYAMFGTVYEQMMIPKRDIGRLDQALGIVHIVRGSSPWPSAKVYRDVIGGNAMHSPKSLEYLANYGMAESYEFLCLPLMGARKLAAATRDDTFPEKKHCIRVHGSTLGQRVSLQAHSGKLRLPSCSLEIEDLKS